MISFFASLVSFAVVVNTAPTANAPLLSWLSSSGGGASVALGTTADGLRGLVATRSAQPGDVLLEVPLACCASDACGDAPTIQPPSCTTDMHWQVQLASSVLTSRAARDWLSSWPEPPPMPLFCTDDELALACDDALSQRVRDDRAWAETQSALVAAAADEEGDAELAAAVRATPTAFLEALALVKSRALRLKAPRPIGMRYLLVPVLDISNHNEKPTAIYSYSPSRGGVVRLHAARRLEEGSAVTIRYGDAGDEHYVEQYGFVPHSNALNAVELPLLRILQSAEQPDDGDGNDNSGDGDSGGDESGKGSADSSSAVGDATEWSMERLSALGVDGAAPYALHASAPSKELLATLRAVLCSQAVDPLRGACGCGDWEGGKVGGFGEGDEELAAAALQCVARAASVEARRIEALGAKADLQAREAGAGSEARAVLRELRQSKLRLLESLGASATRMAGAFAQAHAAGGGGAGMSARMMLEAAVMEAEPPPFPLAPRQLDSWAAREWDWDSASFGS